jgi:hypothetical protein
MSPKELKMQPTTHLQGKYLGLPCKCIVGCIFNSVGLITTRENALYNIFFKKCFSVYSYKYFVASELLDFS